MIEQLTLYTTVTPLVMRSTLLGGFCIGLLGALILVMSGIFLDASLMKTWGLVLFLISMFLITYGLLPYRRLSILSSQPNMIKVDALTLGLHSRGRVELTIPLREIKEINYIEKGLVYGIGIKLQSDAAKEAVRQTIGSKIKAREYLECFNADVFLPYFSGRSCKELQDWMESEPTLNDIM